VKTRCLYPPLFKIENGKKKMKLKLVGMTFSKREFPQLKTENPSGKVKFVRNTKFDKPELPECKGIMVMSGAVRIGWVGNETQEQAIINKAIDSASDKDGQWVDVSGTITECDYLSPRPWCEVFFDAGSAAEKKLAKEPAEDKNFKFYTKDGEKYERASTIMESFDADGATGVEGAITRWMCNAFASYEEYRAFMTDAADKGTAKHSAIEYACKAGILDAEGHAAIEAAVGAISDKAFNAVPSGFWSFIAKDCEGLKVAGLEETVFDDDIMVAGTYDCLLEGNGKRILVDWKSSKKVTLEHIIKTCFYAKLKNADEAWVVALGSKNKSGYQLKKVGRVSVDNGYQILKQAAKAKYFVDDLKASIKAGV